MYNVEFTKEFLKVLKKLKRKNPTISNRLIEKTDEILSDPTHYKPLRNELKGLRRAHIGSFVIIFQIKKNKVVFITFKHHDHAYD